MPEDNTSWSPSTSGESAWKAERERVAARNAETRKAGKATREAYERGRDDMKRKSAAKRRGS